MTEWVTIATSYLATINLKPKAELYILAEGRTQLVTFVGSGQGNRPLAARKLLAVWRQRGQRMGQDFLQRLVNLPVANELVLL